MIPQAYAAAPGSPRRRVRTAMHPQPRKTKLAAKKHQILNLVFREKQCSRFALAQRLNINASMVGTYVGAFLDEGLLREERRRPTRRGRSAAPVRLNPADGGLL